MSPWAWSAGWGAGLRPFHLAIAVRDLAAARAFYGGLLGCPEGRSAERWVDFDLGGHQISAHLVDEPKGSKDGGLGDRPSETNLVDGDGVPVRHFGVVLDMATFEALAQHLEANGVVFRLAPRIRFAGEVGEQATMFLDDPFGNSLEFKAFRDPARLFAR